VQLFGALKATDKHDRSVVQQGRDIYTIGVVLQQVFIGLFTVLTSVFLFNLRARSTKSNAAAARTLTLLLLSVLFLITVKFIPPALSQFRSGELANVIFRFVSSTVLWNSQASPATLSRESSRNMRPGSTASTRCPCSWPQSLSTSTTQAVCCRGLTHLSHLARRRRGRRRSLRLQVSPARIFDFIGAENPT
jgi:hypothetical protein